MITLPNKHKFLYLFILLGLTISFNSCSDDEDDDEPKDQTFLEKYDGTKWVHKIGNTSYYKIINNNLNNLWEFYHNEMDGCYRYSSQFEDGETYEIIENLENKLVYIYRYNSTDYITVTLTVLNDRLSQTILEVEDGVTESDDPWFYDKTSVNIGELDLCD